MSTQYKQLFMIKLLSINITNKSESINLIRTHFDIILTTFSISLFQLSPHYCIYIWLIYTFFLITALYSTTMTNDHRSRYKSVVTSTSWWPINKSIKTLIAVLLLIVIARSSDAARDNLDVPCRFRDSINITDGVRDSDGNIIFENVTYGKNDYGTYDYEFVNDIERRSVESHIRGCVCRLKTCVRLCCARGEHFQSGCTRNESFYDRQIALMDRENASVDLFQEFGYVVGKPCNEVITMEPNEFPDDAWAMMSVSSFSMQYTYAKRIFIWKFIKNQLKFLGYD